MKLIIQIPCFNEEKTLATVIADLPTKLSGINEIEFLVIDDGSTDKTIEIAKSVGVHHVEVLATNRGLATAYKAGIERALKEGANIIVNTDGDNQYCGDCVELIVRPIIDNTADMAVGCRPILNHPEFSLIKKIFQIFGSSVLRKLSQTSVRDCTSGFRAISRETALQSVIHSKFSYTLETLIQAGTNGLRIVSVDIGVNAKTRDSRLFKSVPSYIKRSASTMLATAFYYRPHLVFNFFGILLLLVSFSIGARFLYLVYLIDAPHTDRTYVPSLIFVTISAIGAFLVFSLSFLSNFLSKQRQLLEIILKEAKRSKYDL